MPRAWGRLDRGQLMFGLFAVAATNSLLPAAVQGFQRDGWSSASGLFGFDLAVIAACLVGLALSRGAREGPVRRGDFFAALLTTAIVLAPHHLAGWLGAATLGLWLILRGGASLAAAGALFVAICIYTVWGRLLLTALATPLGEADAALAVAVLGQFRDGVVRHANLIDTGADFRLAIVTNCLSLKAVMVATLACLAFTRSIRPAWHADELWAWAVLAVTAVGLNTVRLALCSIDLAWYDSLHNGAGRPIFNIVLLGAGLAAGAWCVRRELGFAR